MAAALAALNALLNLTAGVLLVLGRRAVRRKDVPRHRALMLAAFATSCLFLVSYVTRRALCGAPRFPAAGWIRTAYLVLLGSHTLLAALVPFLAVRTLWLAWKQRFDAHRAIARITYPIWVYVSVTGVLVYVMLYHVAPRLGGAT